jgi:hypothetical protein
MVTPHACPINQETISIRVIAAETAGNKQSLVEEKMMNGLFFFGSLLFPSGSDTDNR